MRIFLLGFMGSGKTTYGKKIAKNMGLDFIDLDIFIEKTIHRTIKHIFEVDGENRFRDIEREALRDVIKHDNFVLATGGGTPCFFDNLEIMKKNGTTVYLNVDKYVLADRLLHAKIHRPLIWGKSLEELTDFIEDMLKKRNPFYTQAQIIADAKDLNIEQLIENVNNKKYTKKKLIGF